MRRFTAVAVSALISAFAYAQGNGLPEAIPIAYGTEETTELGVGLWGIPIPWDVDGDGLKDLVVTCPDTPYRGTYFFHNIGTKRSPVFDRAVKISGKSHNNLRFSEADGRCFLMVPDGELENFFKDPFGKKMQIGYEGEVIGAGYKRSRSNMWNKVDWDGDGDLDIIVGIDTWDDYGWDNAFNAKGEWTRGPLHGYVYLLENVGGNYINRGKLSAGGKIVDTFGAPCPCVADFDGDGDLDLICGEFRDGLTWYENAGTRKAPAFKAPRQLANSNGDIRFHIEMIVPVPTDFDGDGLTDLIVSDEDGTVSFVRNTGRVKARMPVFESPVKFLQKADLVKFGALCTPCSIDWNGDGRMDIISGNSAGEIAYIENLSDGEIPTWAGPKLIRAGGKPFRVMAGYNGSIQGPAELKWGYTVLSVTDWDGDGLMDIVYNSIWGKVEWLRNLGEKDGLGFAGPQPILVDWEGEAPKPFWNWWTPEKGALVTQWRTTPVAVDWNNDGLVDIVMLDHEGYLAFFERFKAEDSRLLLKPGKRIFTCTNGRIYRNRKGMTDPAPGLLRLNEQTAGASGRRKICFADWDCDGLQDLIVDGTNAAWFRCVRKDSETGEAVFEYVGDMASTKLEGHTTCPSPVDWNRDGVPDLLLGAEDGHFYFIPNVRHPVH